KLAEEVPEKFKGKKLPFYQDVDGFRLPGIFSAESHRSALAYRPRPDDLFVVSYPKCGTTWLQNIIACIHRDGQPFQSAQEFFTLTPCPQIVGVEAVEKMKRPGAIKYHLPYHMMPMSSEAKYIFIARNPKDCCVSFYHFTENVIGYEFQEGEFDVFFELFVEGKTDFGDYFDYLLSWYEHRNDPNVLFITYEELKKDTKTNVFRIAEFMDPQYKEALEKDEKLLEDVIYHSSFSFMKEHFNRHLAEISSLPKDMILNNPDLPADLRELFGGEKKVFHPDSAAVSFVRKGVVGDWRNYFSKEQNERLEKKFRERTAGTDIADLWKDIM
ncbi:sulfotransferase 1C2-like, partial [Uloborus diversus]|uniref:sulfotransferase 1C2-like n=1 Tax=Uloborus diversus TaxID=327109 RepID=UPI002408FB48